MGSFDVSGMNNALQEELDATKQQPNSHGKMDPEAASLARSKGWAAPETYDYSKYVTPGEGEPIPQPAEAVVDDGEFPEWAANALKYEWKDEYGDVGPANEELEEMLFRSEYINRTGLKINK